MSLLEVKDLVVSYGGIEALKGISFSVDEGQIVTLIGANGAGKSTTLRAITGIVPVKSGTILYNGEDITGMDTQKVVERGIALVPEGRRVFANLTVLENLKIGAYLRKDTAQIQKDIEYIYKLFPRLEERSWQLAGTLSGGEQQMLAVGRAMMTRPRLIMMDEPSLGLAPLVVKDIFGIISRLSADGITILLIEQNANAALHAAHYGYVLETGMMTLSGTGEELLSSKSIQEAYLGRGKKGKTCLREAPFERQRPLGRRFFCAGSGFGFRSMASCKARQKPQVGRRYHRHDRHLRKKARSIGKRPCHRQQNDRGKQRRKRHAQRAGGAAPHATQRRKS